MAIPTAQALMAKVLKEHFGLDAKRVRRVMLSLDGSDKLPLVQIDLMPDEAAAMAIVEAITGHEYALSVNGVTDVVPPKPSARADVEMEIITAKCRATESDPVGDGSSHECIKSAGHRGEVITETHRCSCGHLWSAE